MNLYELLEQMPLVAVLRHLTPDNALEIGQALFDAGFRCLEVPLNSPSPCESIRFLAENFGEDALVGAGTVIKLEQVQQVADAGGKLIIMPHTDIEIIKKSKELGMCCIPGVSTPSEAFAALNVGADGLKLFPAEGNPPAVLKAMRAVLPKDVPIIPTGGITPAKMQDYMHAGANGFGLGGALYKPGMSAVEVRNNADEFVKVIKKIREKLA